MDNKKWILEQVQRSTKKEMKMEEEEISRLQLIECVGQYVIENVASSRFVAGKFNISHPTVLSYLEKYANAHPNTRELLEDIKKFNKSLNTIKMEFLNLADVETYQNANIKEKRSIIKSWQLKLEKEHLKRVVLIGEYITRQNASYRKTAKYISSNYFDISHSSIATYYEEYLNRESYGKENQSRKR